MSNGEDSNSALGRLLATGALVGGVGAGIYKGYKDSPGTIERVVKSVAGSVTPSVPRMMVSTPVEFQERLLQEAFDAADDIMGSAGTKELMERVYTRALYGAGIVDDEERIELVAKMLDKSTSWDGTRGVIQKYGKYFSGAEGLYGSLREQVGGTVRGNRRKDVSQIIRELPLIGQDEFGRKGGYLRSAFEKEGSFWKDKFLNEYTRVGNKYTLISSGIGTGVFNRNKPEFLRSGPDALQQALGKSVSAGVRDATRPRLFGTGTKVFEFAIPGAAGQDLVNLPFTEFSVGKKNKWFIQTPQAIKHKGMNLVAADHRGMSFASVPHFAVPVDNGTKYKVVSWNEGINLMLFGDETTGVEGLAQKLHKLHGDAKTQRDLTWAWNTKIRGLFNRVSGTQNDMKLAFMHSHSALPIDRFMKEILGQEVESSIEGLTDFFSKMKSSGYNVGPLAGSDPMAEHYRVSLQDWSSRWDIFGEGYPIERKFASRIKPFSVTDKSMSVMQQSPIGGILPRGHGITATLEAKHEMAAMPQGVAVLSLKEGKHLSAEEGLISRKMKDMMEMKSVSKFEVLEGSTQAQIGQLLEEGTPIGVDYRTGKTIYAKGVKSKVNQRIIDATKVGDIVQLSVETALPWQDQTKLFGYKVQLHKEREAFKTDVVKEYGVKTSSPAYKFLDDAEVAASADLLKKIPQEVNKQMAEASWLVMQKRLSEAGVLRSGGKSKVSRQAVRRMIGDKTYTWKGGLPKDYINMDMFMFVKDEQYRQKILRKRAASGRRVAQRLGLTAEQQSIGTGLDVLRYAKRNKLSSGELGLIGGQFYKLLEKEIGATRTSELLTKIGLSSGDIKGLQEAEQILAMPTMHVGGYASFDHKWGRAGMDYRALMEIKAQNWGETSDLIIGELARRVIPTGDLAELEKAASSLANIEAGIPDNVKRIDNVRDATEALGKESFVFTRDGKELYVPGGETKGMRDFIQEVGETAPEELKSAYSKYFRAIGEFNNLPEEKAQLRLDAASDNLMKKVHKAWASAGSARGKVVGSAGPVARRYLPKNPAEEAARLFSSADDFFKSEKAFTVGITKDTAGKMFRDLLSKASPEERKFLEAQESAFLSGKKITGFVWRHPTHRPQSLMPTWLQLVEGAGESAHFNKLELKHGERILDVSQAAGMKLDFDFDHVQIAAIADEKVKIATDRLLNDRRYREQFIEGVSIQHDIMQRVKNAAASGEVAADLPDYVKGLQRLVGVKMETGPISNLVGEMRASAAFQAGSRDYTIASYLLAELEEGPISSKHGLHVGKTKEHLESFVRNKGSGVKDAMAEAWNKLFEEGTFTADKIKYSRDEFINKMSKWLGASEESGQLAAYKNLARRGAQAQKGKEWTLLTTELLAKSIKDAQGGKGDLNSTLIRSMRMGPGSGISRSRTIVNSIGDAAKSIMTSLKSNWRYPALGLAAAVGISALGGGGDLEMKDHSPQVTGLAGGPSVPHIAPPSTNNNRVITTGGSPMPAGYDMQDNRDFSSAEYRQLTSFVHETGSTARIRDNRGAITPEYIEKAQRERYY